MDCDKFIQQVCDDLAENIDSNFCESLKNHLEECEECRAQVNALRNAVHLYQCLDEKKVPPNMHDRLLKLLNVENLHKEGVHKNN